MCVFVPSGQKILHHRSDVLETVVLINPSDEAVSTEVSIQFCEVFVRSSQDGGLADQGGWVGGWRGMQVGEVPGSRDTQSPALYT